MTAKLPPEDRQKNFDTEPVSQIKDLRPSPALYAQQHSGRSPLDPIPTPAVESEAEQKPARG